MRRWIRWAAWLYPAEWRLRYGAEFDALLYDSRPEWRDLADVIRGAAIMQMTSLNSYWKLGALTGIVGAVLALAGAFMIPDEYVAVASMQLNVIGPSSPGQLAGRLHQITKEVLGRDNLISLIRDPRLDLYHEKLQRKPIEDIAAEMGRKHLKVYLFSGDPGHQAFHIWFEYPDRFKARQVVLKLVEMFEEKSIILQSAAGRSGGEVLEILEQPLVPETPISPVRGRIAVVGAIAGTVMGLLFLTVWRRTRKYAVLNISLPQEIRPFVASQVATGQYRSVSEYVRELIRADEQRKAAPRSQET